MTRALSHTSLQDFLACPRRFEWRRVWRLKRARKPTALHLGDRYHEGLDRLKRGEPLESVLAGIWESFRDVPSWVVDVEAWHCEREICLRLLCAWHFFSAPLEVIASEIPFEARIVAFADDSRGDMITFSRGSCLAHVAVYFLGTTNPFWSNSISGPTRVVRIPGIASGYWQIYGCLIGAQVDSTAHPITAIDWDGAGQVYQQLQVIGSQVSILGPAGLGANGTGLRAAQATGTATSLLVRDSEFVSALGSPAIAIDLAGVADARVSGVSVAGFTTHLAAAQGSAVTVAGSDVRVVTADAGSTIREGGPPVPAASSDPGYEGLVTVDGGFIYRHDGSQWVRAPLVFGAF